ncbi:hypothetical protein CYMTET_30205 [Cymbomonas tetramitiformis]|uniref:TRP C-terminal domain-containing protein n=1 Tax=Cymbomonas tetramitiformis TaxID=36881 RepID=A0AAE0FJK3_9CHLO|nr:hypothetical protein CYMTET_30205 [Cymbomonas tetramitiformis]
MEYKRGRAWSINAAGHGVSAFFERLSAVSPAGGRRAYVQRKRAASAGQASLMSVDMQRSAGVELSANPMYNAMYYSEIDKDREVQAGNEKEILQAVTLNDANFMSEETRRISAYSISNSGHPGRAPTQQEDPQQGRKGKGGRHSSMMMSTQFPSIFFDMKHVSFNSESSSNGGSKQMHIPDALAKSDTFSRGSLDAGDGEDNGLDDFFDYSRGGEEDGAGEEDGKGDASASAADQASRTPATAANREPKPGNREGRATSERNSNMSLTGMIKRFSLVDVADDAEESEEDGPICSQSIRSVLLMRLEVDGRTSDLDALSTFLSISVLFLILMHPTVSTYMFQVFNCERIYYEEEVVRYFLVLDRSLECYTRTWYHMRAVAVLVITLYILGFPLFLAIISYSMFNMKRVEVYGQVQYVPKNFLIQNRKARAPSVAVPNNAQDSEEYTYHVYHSNGLDLVQVEPLWRAPGHMQSALQHPLVQALIGPQIEHFKPTHFYWGLCYEILRRVLSTSAVILVQTALNGARYDLIYAQTMSILALILQAQVKPYNKADINLVQTLSIGSQALIMLLLTTNKYITTTTAATDTVGWLMVVMQIALFVFIGLKMLHYLIPWIQTHFPQSDMFDQGAHRRQSRWDPSSQETIEQTSPARMSFM